MRDRLYQQGRLLETLVIKLTYLLKSTTLLFYYRSIVLSCSLTAHLSPLTTSSLTTHYSLFSLLPPRRYQHPFRLVLGILPEELFQPGDGLAVPALAVEVEHGVGREDLFGVRCFLFVEMFFLLLMARMMSWVEWKDGHAPLPRSRDWLSSAPLPKSRDWLSGSPPRGESVSPLARVVANSLARTFASSRHGFVADVEAVAVPAAAGVGEVEELDKVDSCLAVYLFA